MEQLCGGIEENQIWWQADVCQLPNTCSRARTIQGGISPGFSLQRD